MMVSSSIVSTAAVNVANLYGVRLEEDDGADKFLDPRMVYLLFDDTSDIALHTELERRLSMVRARHGISDTAEVERAVVLFSKPTGEIEMEVHQFVFDDEFDEDDYELNRFKYEFAVQQVRELVLFYAQELGRDLMKRYSKIW